MSDEETNGAPAPNDSAPEGATPNPAEGDSPNPAEGDPPNVEGDGPPAGETTAGKWGDDWRQNLAASYAGASEGEAYDKELKRLERMSSPSDVYKSFRELDKKMSSGELKGPAAEFPADGSDEDKAKWRADNGLPADPKGYEEALDGIVMGDEQKPLLDLYLEAAHENNVPPEYVKSAVDWYLQLEEQTNEAQNAADVEYHNQSVESLKGEYGAEYDRNMGDLKNWLNNMGDGVGENLLGARLADGTLLGDNPDVLKGLISQMRMINPLSTVVPAGGADGLQSVEDEINDIQRMIATEPQKYWGDKSKQERFQQLVAAREQYKRQAAS